MNNSIKSPTVSLYNKAVEPAKVSFARKLKIKDQ